MSGIIGSSRVKNDMSVMMSLQKISPSSWRYQARKCYLVTCQTKCVRTSNGAEFGFFRLYCVLL